jgi:tRNA1Val (adenine37-N6)-methyltransferase
MPAGTAGLNQGRVCRRTFGQTEFMTHRAVHDDQTEGHLLGGRVRYAQPRTGFRSGIEPLLLAASVPARPGESVLEGGTGAGATLLCLAARVPDLQAVGVERDHRLAALARQNAAANDQLGLSFIVADMMALPDTRAFDHACANPPYHSPGGTASPDAAREASKRSHIGLAQLWATALAERLRSRGTLTFIVPAAILPVCIEAFAAAGCPPTAMLPLWPKAGREAKLMLLRGVKGGRAPFRVLPGLLLHDAGGRFTQDAEAILRHGRALAF